MGEIVVRAAIPEDIGAITRIYEHYVLHTTATFEIEPPAVEEMAARYRGVLELGMPYLAAADGGAVIGYAYAHLYRTRAAYRFTVEDSIYVDPEQVGRGCGQALLAGLISECEQGPWRQMVAVIGGSENAASIALHRRCGFEAVGTLRSAGYKFGRWVDGVLMQRGLGGA